MPASDTAKEAHNIAPAEEKRDESRAKPEAQTAKRDEISRSDKIPMRRWGDAVKKISASDMALGSFIRGSAALEGGGYLYIIFDKPFGISLMNDKRKGDISAVIKETAGKYYPPEKIICTEQAKAENLIGEPIEELMKKFEEYGKEE